MSGDLTREYVKSGSCELPLTCFSAARPHRAEVRRRTSPPKSPADKLLAERCDMNGRRPTMCVTVGCNPILPWSIPTETMQRMSRPGGWSGRPRFVASPRSLRIDGAPC